MAKRAHIPSSKKNVTYFNLDEVATDEVIIKLGGVEYPLVPVSVENFVSNTRLMAQLGDVSGDMEKSLELTTKLLNMAFPSMSVEIIKSMTMLQLGKLVDLAHGMNGQKDAEKVATEEATAVADANPTQAG